MEKKPSDDIKMEFSRDVDAEQNQLIKNMKPAEPDSDLLEFQRRKSVPTVVI